MGLDINGTRFLLVAKASGVCFAKTATIGRQGLDLDWKYLKRILRHFHINKTDDEVKRLLSEANGYAEPFLRMLGAVEICSIDASPFEGASLIHDMNLPIPDTLKNAFTVVLDGGSLEHVFDFPRAIKNCMEMLQVGGHFLGITPANNFMGHGFYQFSPDLHFRIFSQNNGFSIESMVLFESPSTDKWYEVTDPEKTRKGRVEFINNRPTFLLIQAKKVGCVPIFSSLPQQSDYVALWNSYSNSLAHRIHSEGVIQRILRVVKRRTPRTLKNVYRFVLVANKSRLNSEFFREVDVIDLAKGK